MAQTEAETARPTAKKAGRVEHRTVAERIEIGKAARKQAPRAGHAEFEPSAGRPDPIELLERQAETRVPELVPIRYGRMMLSPFAFYRGGALIMASDLARTAVSGIRVQLCGDAHLSNFGVFASAERTLVFDLNDFDETLPGPWEWDVKRLAASLAIAGRENAFPRKVRKGIVRAMMAGYRTAMQGFATMPNLAVWYAHMDVESELATVRDQIHPSRVKMTERALAKARTKDSMSAFSKLTEEVDGEPRIISDPPLIMTVRDLVPGARADEVTGVVQEFVRGYRRTLQSDRRLLLEQFRFVDMARKVVGVGSVGTRAWIALFMGLDGTDPLFLQIKEAQPSVLEEFAGKSRAASAGERVVNGQHLMQSSSDIFLGWRRMPTPLDGAERDFYVRQLKDWKGSAEVEQMIPSGMAVYGRLCGWTLARAHARSGDRVALAAYLGSSDAIDSAMAEFAESYADQNEIDYAALVEAVKSGRLVAETGL